MNADYFRKLYAYHIATNRKIWKRSILTLTDEQFAQKLDYSVGSIRNQVVHVLSVDERWFAGLRGVDVPDFKNPVHYPKRAKIRTIWDTIEAQMQDHLAKLTDGELSEPYPDLPEMQIWEVLLHVANHGTDHRAQILAGLDQLGAPTFPQDYFFFCAGN